LIKIRISFMKNFAPLFLKIKTTWNQARNSIFSKSFFALRQSEQPSFTKK